MEPKGVVVTPRRVVAQSFAEFFRDLVAGDPVALGLCFGFVAFLLVLAVLGAWILFNRKMADRAHRKKIADRRRKEREKDQYGASRSAPEI